MRFRHSVTLLLGAAALTLSCASAHKFAERSQQELAAGQTDKAYESALQAYRHDQDAPGVGAALSNAANARATEWKQRVHSLAPLDTVKAANQAVAFESFRREVTGYGVVVPVDSTYANEERAIRRAAAVHARDAGEAELRAEHAKVAYRHFQAAHSFVPTDSEIARRMSVALKQATQRVAFLPFTDDTRTPGLSRDLGDRVQIESLKRIGDDQLEFTTFIPRSEVLDRLTVSEDEHMTRATAIAVGRRIGASRVVWGRASNPSVDTNTNHYVESLWRREEFRDTSGTRVRYVEEPFDATERQRVANVHWELEVIDVNDESAVSRREGNEQSRARAVWTRFRPHGDPNDYCLVPPDMKSRDGSRAKRVESGWHDTFGDWKVPKFLDLTRGPHVSVAGPWTSMTGGDWDNDWESDWSRPPLVNDLPGKNAMIRKALANIWSPGLAVIKEQDAR